MAASPFQSPHDLTLAATETATPIDNVGPMFVPRDISDLEHLAESPALIEGLADYCNLGMIHGDANTGKTFFALDFAIRLVLGKPLLGDDEFSDFRALRPLRVLYVFGEGNPKMLRRRVVAAMMAHGITWADLQGRFMYLQIMPDLSSPENVSRFVSEVCERGQSFDLIILDTFSDAKGNSKESDNDEQNEVMRAAQRMAAAEAAERVADQLPGRMVMFVHHAPKNSLDTIRGAGAIRAKLDFAIGVEGDCNPRTISCTKSRDFERFQKRQFNLNIERVNPSDPRQTSCSVEWMGVVDGKAEKKPTKGSQTDAEVLDALAKHATNRVAALTTGDIAKRCYSQPSQSSIDDSVNRLLGFHGVRSENREVGHSLNTKNRSATFYWRELDA